jgi:SAM-dependent methyltransferase
MQILERKYPAENLDRMLAISNRQIHKDRHFLPILERQLIPGRVLEVGAGCGQLSLLLTKRGWDVTSTDYFPHFVTYLQSIGLRARQANALELSPDIDGVFDNVIAQGVSTLVEPRKDWIELTYRSMRNVVKDGGRFVFIFPNAYGQGPWSRLQDQLVASHQEGWRIVRRFRHQVFPSKAYGFLPAPMVDFAESTVGKILGLRWVLVFEKR